MGLWVLNLQLVLVAGKLRLTQVKCKRVIFPHEVAYLIMKMSERSPFFLDSLTIDII